MICLCADVIDHMLIRSILIRLNVSLSHFACSDIFVNASKYKLYWLSN